MSDSFPIYQVTEIMKVAEDYSIQLKGVLTKSWYEHPDLGLCLFKAATSARVPIPNVRNDWVEKVVYEISKLLDLPTARYEFALAWNEERQSFVPGSLSVNCLPPGAESIPGGDLLANTFANYEAGYPLSYSVDNVLKALTQNEVGCPQNWVGIAGIDRATDLFVGYLALDAVCGGVDRHPNNWEVMVVDGRLDLVPSFDHGSSLGGNLSESTRATIAASGFAPNLMKSAFWNNTERIDPIQAFEIAVRLYPQIVWQQRLKAITPTQINDIFARIPEGRITAAATKFAIDLLASNRQALASV
ncbi:hypothetical protein [Chamaesiphon sp.]|jgi:hypothetical protein|uniref:hypothetical protein n=1 Tax=Chamaesiphon sp. TaxID=2814140 RepID=UPI0035934478